MNKIKVVLHVMAGQGTSDSCYGNDGVVFHELEDRSGVKLDFVSFCGQFLDGQTIDRFIAECRDAQVIIVDAWNHPLRDTRTWPQNFDPEGSMAQIVQRVIRDNPTAQIFADLMEGVRKVAVHQYAKPIKSWTDESIVDAIMGCVRTEGLPNVLVFDDSVIHTKAAHKQLSASYNVVTVSSYDRAEAAIEKGGFKIVLLDLLVPASGNQQGEKGKEFVGKEMPITPFLLLLAMKNGVKKIGLLTDAGHHDHPASACIDAFGNDPWSVGDIKIVLSNRDITSDGGIRVKDWKSLVDKLN
ncbi:MAG: hypothetical protein WCW14_00525 [Candidatus Paceibacterota bacterium]|jgi:hypothetical protein